MKIKMFMFVVFALMICFSLSVTEPASACTTTHALKITDAVFDSGYEITSINAVVSIFEVSWQNNGHQWAQINVESLGSGNQPNGVVEAAIMGYDDGTIGLFALSFYDGWYNPNTYEEYFVEYTASTGWGEDFELAVMNYNNVWYWYVKPENGNWYCYYDRYIPYEYFNARMANLGVEGRDYIQWQGYWQNYGTIYNAEIAINVWWVRSFSAGTGEMFAPCGYWNVDMVDHNISGRDYIFAITYSSLHPTWAVW